MTETKNNVQRKYKDTMFRHIFNNKVNLLSLYNAVNGTAYENPEDIRINTLENAVYLNMKNDVSCVIGFHLNLYEHQSTYSPNMPLRDLFYIARLLEGELGDRSIYSTKLIKMPTPKFLVFYNGTEEQPECRIQKLSEAFEQPGSTSSVSGSPDLELKVTMLNINTGKNKELMEQCRVLKEYMIYVDKVRTYTAFMELEAAVNRAVDECIQENVLRDYLTKYRAEAIQVSIFEFDEEREMKLIREAEREIGWEEGREEGRVEGLETGRTEGRAEGELYNLVRIIRINHQKGRPSEEIADILGVDKSLLNNVIDMIEKNKNMQDNEIIAVLMKK